MHGSSDHTHDESVLSFNTSRHVDSFIPTRLKWVKLTIRFVRRYNSVNLIRTT